MSNADPRTDEPQAPTTDSESSPESGAEESAAQSSRAPEESSTESATIVPLRGDDNFTGKRDKDVEEHIHKQKKKFQLRYQGLLHPGLVPTSLVQSGERSPMKILPPPTFRWPLMWLAIRNVIRFLSLLRRNKRRDRFDVFLNRIGRLDDGKLLARQRARAEAIRDFCADRGGIWIKGAQLIAARRDLISEVTSDALDNLHDRAPGFPPELARAQIEKALGKPVEEVFVEFNPHPLAAATIGQIHTAQLRYKKTKVVIKVRRPDIEKVFKREMGLVKWLADFCTKRGLLKQLRPDELYQELEHMIVDELDYRIEAHSGKLLRKVLADHRVYAPKIFMEYSTADVLVMEYVPGVLMSDFLRLRNAEPERVKDWCEENNVKTKKLAGRFYDSFQRQLFEDNLFHADMHPGNVMLLRNSRFALIDFGSVGMTDKSFLEKYTYYLSLLIDHEYSKAFDLWLHMMGETPPFDKPKVIRDMARLQQFFDYRASVKAIPYREKSSSATLGKMLQVLGRYKIPPAHEFTKLNRTIFAAESTVEQLLPTQSVAMLMQDYWDGRQKRLGTDLLLQDQADLNTTTLRRATSILEKLDDNLFYYLDRIRAISKEATSRERSIGQAVLAIVFRAFGLILLFGVLAFLHDLCVDVQHSEWASRGLLGTVVRTFANAEYFDYFVWGALFVALIFMRRKIKGLQDLA
ncbi:MAG: AarF/UbiB family protein [Myxococcota bacterium]